MNNWTHIATTENGRWRIYKRKTPLKYLCNFSGTIMPAEEWDKKVKHQYTYVEHCIVLPQTFDTVIVSDAHTHRERLCFMAEKYINTKDNTEHWNITSNIAGRNTGMSRYFPGDEYSIKDDEVYLRFLDILQIKGEQNEEKEKTIASTNS